MWSCVFRAKNPGNETGKSITSAHSVCVLVKYFALKMNSQWDHNNSLYSYLILLIGKPLCFPDGYVTSQLSQWIHEFISTDTLYGESSLQFGMYFRGASIISTWRQIFFFSSYVHNRAGYPDITKQRCHTEGVLLAHAGRCVMWNLVCTIDYLSK